MTGPGRDPSDELPPGIGPDAPDVESDPEAAMRRGQEMVDVAGRRIVAGVEAEAPRYLRRRCAQLLDAWSARDDPTRRRAEESTAAAADAATDRVVGELRRLLAADVGEQRATPLQVVRGLHREPGVVLSSLGVPPVRRDEAVRRTEPDDHHGLAPVTLADLGDEELGPLLLVWGVGKATVLRARSVRSRARSVRRSGEDL